MSNPTREGALDAFTVPSLVNGQRVQRRAPASIQALPGHDDDHTDDSDQPATGSAPYTPGPGTLAERVLNWLRAQPPGTTLTTAQATDLFEVPRGYIGPCLKASVKYGLIDLTYDGGAKVYSLGTGKPPAEAPAAAPSAREDGAGADVPAGAAKPSNSTELERNAPGAIVLDGEGLELYRHMVSVAGELFSLLGLPADRPLAELTAAVGKLMAQNDRAADLPAGASGPHIHVHLHIERAAA